MFFGLDLIEEESKCTLWTHKPNVWKDLFDSVLELSKTGQVETINPMFHGILACPVRATPKGPNENQFFKSAKGQKIYHWILLVPMPADVEPSDYIQKFIFNFQALTRKPYIKSAYKNGVQGFTKHHGLLNQVDEEGNYWTVIENVSQKDVLFQAKTCLSEVLMDCTIQELVSLIFNAKKTKYME